MRKIHNAVPLSGSGDAALNFEVVGSVVQPNNPKENTIWINTETAIGEWQFSAVEPTTRADGSVLSVGDLWVEFKDIGQPTINIFKKNSVRLSLDSAYQWDGSEWKVKVGQVYLSEGWVPMEFVSYIFKEGNGIETFVKIVVQVGCSSSVKYEINSASTVTYKTLNITCSANQYQWSNSAYSDKVLYDLTDYKYLTVRWSASTGSTSKNVFCGVTDTITAASGEFNSFRSNSLAYGSGDNFTHKTSGECTLDISAIAGSHYVYLGATGTYSSSFTIYFTEMLLHS